MFRQLEWWVQNGPIPKNGVLPVTTFFFDNFVSVYKPLIKSWFDVLTNEMPIFILYVRDGVLFESAFPCEYPQVPKNT